MPKRKKGKGEWIRDYLNTTGRAYVGELHREYVEWCEGHGYTPGSYEAMRREVWLLKELGLIEPAGTEPAERGPFDRQYYRIAPGVSLSDSRWSNPQRARYGSYNTA